MNNEVYELLNQWLNCVNNQEISNQLPYPISIINPNGEIIKLSDVIISYNIEASKELDVKYYEVKNEKLENKKEK